VSFCFSLALCIVWTSFFFFFFSCCLGYKSFLSEKKHFKGYNDITLKALFGLRNEYSIEIWISYYRK
jgi:hypothetical protein